VLGFATGDDKKKFGVGDEQQPAADQKTPLESDAERGQVTREGAKATDSIATIKNEVTSGIEAQLPLEASTELSALQEHAEPLFRIMQEEMHETVSKVAVHAGILQEAEAETWTAANFTDEQRRRILETILQSPKASLKFQETLQTVLDRRDLYSRTAEKRVRYLLGILGEGDIDDPEARSRDANDVDLISLIRMDPPILDREEIRKRLKLEEKYPDPAQQEIQLDKVHRALTESEKARKQGLTTMDALPPGTSPEEEEAVREQYFDQLENQKETLEKVLFNQLRRTAKQVLEKNRQTEREQLHGLTREQILEKFGADGAALHDEIMQTELTALGILGEIDTVGERLLTAIEASNLKHLANNVRDEAELSSQLQPGRNGDSENLMKFIGRKNRILAELLEDVNNPNRFLQKKLDQQMVEDWGKTTVDRIQALHDRGDQKTTEALDLLVESLLGEKVYTYEDKTYVLGRLLALDVKDDEMARINDYLTSLEAASALSADDEENPEATVPDGPIKEICDKTHSRLSAAMGTLLNGDKLSPALEHPLADVLGVKEGLKKRKTSLEQSIREAGLKSKSEAESKALLKSSLEEIARLERCAAELQDLNSRIVIDDKLEQETGRRGSFEPIDGKIHLASSLVKGSKDYNDILDHERGHLIIHTLTRTSKVFPMLLWKQHSALEKKKDASGRSFNQLLESMGSYWGLTSVDARIQVLTTKKGKTQAEARRIAERMYLHALLDELMVSYTSWDGSKPSDGSQEKKTEHTLFLMLRDLEKSKRQTVEEAIGELMSDEDILEMERRFITPPPTPGTPPGSPPGTPPGTPGSDEWMKDTVKDDLQQVKKDLVKISQFQKAYPHVHFFADAEQDRTYFEAVRHAHENILTEYNTNPAANQKMLRSRASLLQQEVGKRVKEIQEFDTKRLDITGEERDAPGLLDNLSFVSINDLIKLGKDIMEDIHHIHKRRQDRALQHVGGIVTKALRKGENVPWFGEYFQEINQYHERRYSGEEQKAANEWKEGLENEDSTSVLEMIEGSHNKDQIRGIITLLCSRGEMNWNDDKTWLVLMHLSGYHQMPVEACKRDDLLRDTWLRRMVDVIWKDKELYYQWRLDNDSKFDSGKKNFEAKVDQLSNVKGGMAGELEKQLRIYTLWRHDKDNNIHRPLPVDVKMHLYEETITYAIEKGKMTMEQKLFYLVQGVASGLLSIDRLRVLASKYLNLLPFIDYFYGRNNTLPEVQALAKRLLESETDPEKRFKPGIKTTLWIHYEVSREKSAQERLSKALSGARAENIDHEDIPFFITNADVSSVNNMTGVISGTRMKLSPEAAKNAYVGWSSKFKVFGALMQAEEDGIEKVTARDVEMLSQTLIGYIHYDNIVTRNVTDKFEPTERVMLTENQFQTVPPSSDGKSTTMDYRKGMTGLLAALLDTTVSGVKLEKMIQDKMDACTEQVEVETEEVDPVTHRKKKTLDVKKKFKTYTVKQFISTTHGLSRNNKKDAMGMYALYSDFYQIFLDVIRTPEGQKAFKEVLRVYAAKDTDPVRLRNEGGSSGDDGFTVDRGVDIINEWKIAA
jgi:hypothetical protein